MADYEPPAQKCVDRCDEKTYGLLIATLVATGTLIYYTKLNIFFSPFIFILLLFPIFALKRTLQNILSGPRCSCRFI